MKPVIGIVPNSTYQENDDSFFDTYRYSNNFVKKIVENGGIPYFIPYVNNEVIMESLDNIDGVILPGGNKVLKSTFKVIDYCISHNKPVLGVCLGMQTLAMYSVNKDLDGEYKNILVKDDSSIHWPFELKRDDEDRLAHDILVNKGTRLYDLIGEKRKVNSVHNYCVNEVGSDFIVSAYSSDGVIEGIEYKDKSKFLMGVQFHPEVLDEFNNIFASFIEACK